MNRFFSVLLALLTLGLVIVVHESGHFAACKVAGVAVPRFSIGFGPVIVSTTIGETEFALSALPLGGYVSMDPVILEQKTYVTKVMIILAGILCNILFAFFIIIILFFLNRVRPTARLEKIYADSPAQKAGMQEGDTITRINDTYIKNDITPLVHTIMQSAGTPITFYTERDDQEHVFTITPIQHPYLQNKVGYIGIVFATEKTNRTLIQTISHALQSAWDMLERTARALFGLARKEEREKLSGPIGTIAVTSVILQQGFITYLLMLASINMQIALFNLLPVPFFDGGQLLRYTLEAGLGGKVPPNIITIINILFFIGLMLLIGYLSKQDIERMQ